MASSITRRQALVAATALAVVPSAASATNRYSVISISNENSGRHRPFLALERSRLETPATRPWRQPLVVAQV